MSTLILQHRALSDAYEQIDYELADSPDVVTTQEYEDMVYDRFLRLCRERLERLEGEKA